MNDQRGWQERYGVADLQANHWLALLALLLVFTAPVVAMLKDGDAGLVFFGSGLFAFMLAILTTPDETDQ